MAECLKTNRTLKFLDITYNNITEIGVTEIVEVLQLNPIFEALRIDSKNSEILKPYTYQLLYNKTIDTWYHIEINSNHSTYQFDQCISLIRVWTGDNVRQTDDSARYTSAESNFHYAPSLYN